MVTGTDRRRVARLTVPRRFRGGELELHLVHVLDLSRSERGSHTESRCTPEGSATWTCPRLSGGSACSGAWSDPAPCDRADPGGGPAGRLRERPGVHQSDRPTTGGAGHGTVDPPGGPDRGGPGAVRLRRRRPAPAAPTTNRCGYPSMRSRMRTSGHDAPRRRRSRTLWWHRDELTSSAKICEDAEREAKAYRGWRSNQRVCAGKARSRRRRGHVSHSRHSVLSR